MKAKRLWRLLGPFLLCTILLLGVSGGKASAETDPSSVAMQGTVEESDAAIQAYWTPERQNAAILADTLMQGQQIPTPPLPSEIGPAVSVPPTTPAQSVAASQDQPRDSGIEQQAYAISYPYPFPLSTVGKVFFSDPVTKYNYVCSGTAVTSRNRSTVDTAGHCVAAGGEKRYYTNWAFCPQYYQSCPRGNLWSARSLWTHRNWYNNGAIEYDYGEAVVSPNSRGKLVDAIGGAGWAINQSYNQTYHALGFPAGAPFDGSRLQYCPSAFYDYDNPGSGPKTLAITCDMTGGSSGGGWLVTLNGVFGYVNGHNDYKYNNDSAHMYSPYYGNDWFSVFNAAQRA